MNDNALTKTLDAASDSGTRDAVSHSIAFIVFAARGGQSRACAQRTSDTPHAAAAAAVNGTGSD